MSGLRYHKILNEKDIDVDNITVNENMSVNEALIDHAEIYNLKGHNITGNNLAPDNDTFDLTGNFTLNGNFDITNIPDDSFVKHQNVTRIRSNGEVRLWLEADVDDFNESHRAVFQETQDGGTCGICIDSTDANFQRFHCCRSSTNQPVILDFWRSSIGSGGGGAYRAFTPVSNYLTVGSAIGVDIKTSGGLTMNGNPISGANIVGSNMMANPLSIVQISGMQGGNFELSASPQHIDRGFSNVAGTLITYLSGFFYVQQAAIWHITVEVQNNLEGGDTLSCRLVIPNKSVPDQNATSLVGGDTSVFSYILYMDETTVFSLWFAQSSSTVISDISILAIPLIFL